MMDELESGRPGAATAPPSGPRAPEATRAAPNWKVLSPIGGHFLPLIRAAPRPRLVCSTHLRLRFGRRLAPIDALDLIRRPHQSNQIDSARASKPMVGRWCRCATRLFAAGSSSVQFPWMRADRSKPNERENKQTHGRKHSFGCESSPKRASFLHFHF